jgi:hypothetical protein
VSHPGSSVPREFEIPPRVREQHLALLESALAGDAHASAWRRPPARAFLLIAALVVLAVAAIATAARLGLFDREVTRADLEARVTTLTQTIGECRATGDCGPLHTETVRVGEIRPSDGITLVDPAGLEIKIVPGAGTIQFPTASGYGSELVHSHHENNGSEYTEVELPDGGSRTFSWRAGEGHVTVTDSHHHGTSTQTVLRSGDVVALLPGTLNDQPLTPDKAVTFELSRTGYAGVTPLLIYPQRNEAFVFGPPSRAGDGPTTRLPADVARRYGLLERDGHYELPINPAGGSWSYTLASGQIRTVTWNAGATTVTVTDRTDTGKVLGTDSIPIGREVYAG